MFICLFVFFQFESCRDTPRNIFWKFQKNQIWFSLDIVDLKCVYLFVCLFVFCIFCIFCILIILEHPQEYTLKISWRSNLIWLIYSRSKTFLFVYSFVCLFVCLLTCFFYFNHFGTSTEVYPENFVKIQLDLADIFKI